MLAQRIAAPRQATALARAAQVKGKTPAAVIRDQCSVGVGGSADISIAAAISGLSFAVYACHARTA
jgi:hypothetical protein